MEFKIELKDIEQLSIEKGRIITNKKGKKIEYIINNDVITEVNPYDETRIAEEKINKLLDSDDGVKRINTIIQMTKNKPVNSKYHYDYKPNANKENVESPTPKTDVYRAKGIISLEKVGVLDEIAAKNRDKIAKTIYGINDEKDCDGKQIDITICHKSIDKLKDEIISMLPNLENNGNNKFWDKVNAYKEYFNKRNQLRDELFNERVEKLESEDKE